MSTKATDYLTLGRANTAEWVVNKSRFICYAAPIDNEEGALALISQAKAEHKTATHHCYAYVVGLNNGIMRYSDDGEPQGTAGVPILDVLKVKDIKNACLVVVRYFGGVLLGAGGLVRAYARSASLGVEAATMAKMTACHRLTVTLPYPVYDRLSHVLGDQPCLIESTDYSDNIQIKCLVPDLTRHPGSYNPGDGGAGAD